MVQGRFANTAYHTEQGSNHGPADRPRHLGSNVRGRSDDAPAGTI